MPKFVSTNVTELTAEEMETVLKSYFSKLQDADRKPIAQIYDCKKFAYPFRSHQQYTSDLNNNEFQKSSYF